MWLENLSVSERHWTVEMENECSETENVLSKKVAAYCLGKPSVTHLAFDVYELGKHQRRIEGQLSYIVVVLFAAYWLLGGRKQSKGTFYRHRQKSAEQTHYNMGIQERKCPVWTLYEPEMGNCANTAWRPTSRTTVTTERQKDNVRSTGGLDMC